MRRGSDCQHRRTGFSATAALPAKPLGPVVERTTPSTAVFTSRSAVTPSPQVIDGNIPPRSKLIVCCPCGSECVCVVLKLGNQNSHATDLICVESAS
jgi:hypothetical protein